MAAPQTSRFSTEASLRGPAALQVLDEAVALLRRTPLELYVLYYAGALPYAASLVYFIFDMLQSSMAEEHLIGEALLVTGTYFWMKTCQAVFSRRLLAILEGMDLEPWTVRRWINTALLQAIFSATFFLIWPVALLVTIPFGWVHAFYHSVSIVGTGRATTVRGCMAEAMNLAGLWTKQNHLMLGAMLAGILLLFVNVMVFLSLLPRLLNMLFGISTVFDESFSAWNNSSFYLDVSVLCFLIFNPLSKALYVLRCFYGRSRLNGADLRSGLRRWRALRPAAALVVALGVLCAGLVRADTAPAKPAPAPAPAGQVSPDVLDHSIQKTLDGDEFAWRAPKPPQDHKDEGFIAHAVRQFLHLIDQGIRAIFKSIGDFLRWLFHTNDSHDTGGNGGGEAMAAIPWNLVFWVVLIVVVALLAWLLLPFLRPVQLSTATTVKPVEVKTVDLESETVRADALPEDMWLSLAQELLEKGETRLALRALYLATLSLLAQRELIRLGAAKSNRDYLQELVRRLRDRADAIQPFRDSVRLFEASWYGTHAATLAIIETMRFNHQTVRSHVAA